MINILDLKLYLIGLLVFIKVEVSHSQSVQQQLNNGVHPCSITNSGNPIDSVIGKMYNGGFIYHFDTINCEGLIAAPEIQDTSASWGCFLTDLNSVPNVPSAASPSGLGAELYDGRANTFGILFDCGTEDIAADLASSYSGGGFNDWHLPSILELVEMHSMIGQGASNIAKFDNDLYWASSESSAGNSWILNFTPTTTSFALGGKHLNLRVRASRKLLPPVIIPCHIIFVDSAATGANTGISWVDAFNHIEAAFATAANCDTILVAKGTYFPDTTGLIDHRTASFIAPNSIPVFGGFPNGGGSRNINSHPTILSGAIDSGSNQYCYHVVTMKNLGNNTRLDGFTIKNGRADGGGINQSDAGGIFHVADGTGPSSSPTIANCRFINNIGMSRGGAIYNLAADSNASCTPVIVNCHFQSNQVLGSNGEGGGMCNDALGGYCFVTIDSCVFLENNVVKSGGAIHNHANSNGETSFSIKNTLFQNNVALGSDGGGLSCFHVMGKTPNATIENCQFIDNISNFGGGGLSAGVSQDDDSIQMTLTDCLFEGNNVLDGDGGGIAYYVFGGQSSIKITRSKFTNNTCKFSGGGIHLFADDSFARCNSTMIDCVFEGNSATYGGGVSLLANFGQVETTLIQSLFFNDTAHIGGAIDMFSQESSSKVSPDFLNCTFVKNKTNGSSAITAEAVDGEVSPFILNSIIWANQDTLGQAGFISFNATPTLNYTLVDTSCAGLGNNVICGDSMIYNIDPNFINIDSCDFHFNGGSIAVNAGQNDSLIANAVLLDLDERLRIQSTIADLGVYEFSACPNTISLLNKNQTAGSFHAITKVESNGFLLTTNNGIYRAGVEIELLPEFEVRLGAEFEASIAPCNP